MKREESSIDEMLLVLKEELSHLANDNDYSQFAYVTSEDILRLSNLDEIMPPNSNDQ